MNIYIYMNEKKKKHQNLNNQFIIEKVVFNLKSIDLINFFKKKKKLNTISIIK